MFGDLLEMQRFTNQWLKHYNEEGSHEALNQLTLIGYANKIPSKCVIPAKAGIPSRWHISERINAD